MGQLTGPFQLRASPVCGIIAAKQLLYQNDGQDDTRAKPAPVPMADYTTSLRDSGIIAAKQLLYQGYGQDDYTTSLRDSGIIAAKQLLYQGYGQDDTRAKPAPVPMADYTTSLRDVV